MKLEILDNFILPEGAAEGLAAMEAKGASFTNLDEGVSSLTIGHDKGVSYRFFIHSEYSQIKSDLMGYEVYEPIELIEWFKDRGNKIVERVKELPAELLKFSREGEPVGGRYLESYKKFKLGQMQEGTPLTRWGLMPDYEVASLTAIGVYTVEQFAEFPTERLAGKYPETFLEAQKRAVQYIKGRSAKEAENIAAEKILQLTKQNQALAKRIEALEASGILTPPSKEVVVEEEVDSENAEDDFI